MGRTYHVDIARHASTAEPKWMDNLLSHFEVPGVTGGRQGRPRRISESGVSHIVLIRRLSAALGTPNGDSLAIATKLLTDHPVLTVAPGMELSLDRSAFENEVRALIAHAVEAVVPPRRGRPSRRRFRQSDSVPNAEEAPST